MEARFPWTASTAAWLAAAAAVLAPLSAPAQDYSITDLGSLGGSYSIALAIDDAGDVAGNSFIAGDTAMHAFVYREGVLNDLGPASQAPAPAAPAQIGGWLWNTRSGNSGAVHAFMYQSYLQDLGSLGGAASVGYGVNAAGLAVGSSAVPGADGAHAFVFRDGRMRDLNDLAQARQAGWVLQSARAINARGQIVGFGLHQGRTSAYLLTPQAAPLAFLPPASPPELASR